MAGKRSPRGEARRNEILQVALDVFTAEGFAHASLREVARRCDTSTAGILYYFGTKENLFVSVLRARDSSLPEEVLDPQALDRERLPGDLARFRAQLARNQASPGLVSLFVAMASEARTENHPASEFFHRRYEQRRRFIAEYMTALDIKTRPGLTQERAAAVTLAIMDGAQLQWLADDTFDMAATIEEGILALYEVEAPGSD